MTIENATFMGHPRGLATLFFTEMWERFSYYGGRALLMLFMTYAITEGGMGLTETKAGAIYGLYTGAVYLLCLPGGWVADRLIGQQNAVYYGGILISLGNFMLAVPSEAMFYLGLVVIVLGTGLLKPNVSAIVGQIYKDDTGARRDAGFSIFYMGINLGAFIAPLIAGTVGENYSWRMGFAVAGAAMLLGVIQYKLTSKYLGDAGLRPYHTTTETRRLEWYGVWAGLGLLALAIVLIATGIWQPNIVGLATNVGVIIVSIAVFFFGSVLLFGKLAAVEKKRVAVIAIFFLAAAMFWSGFEQAATTFNLFADRYTDRSLLGGFFRADVHPTTWYQSLNPVFIIILSPVFAWIWVELGKRNLEPSAPLKFSLGLIQLGLGFGIMAAAAGIVVSTGMPAAPTWLLLTYLIHTTGELCLSPIGLSAVTKLSPPRYVGQMMGTWFMGASLGNLIAGLIGGHVGGSDISEMPAQFMQMLWIGGGAGVLMLILFRPIRKMMGGIK